MLKCCSALLSDAACSALLSVAACHTVLQCVVVLQCTFKWCSVSQGAAVLQYTSKFAGSTCSVLQCAAACCSVLLCVAVCWSVRTTD